MTILLDLLAIYLLLGALFAVAFVWKGAGRIDPDAAEGSLGFRLAIWPGVVALWPLMARRWISGRAPQERSAHRLRARSGS
jgi:hypothetical protein